MNWNKDKVLQMANTRIINYSGKTLCDNYKNPLERCKMAAQAIRLFKNCISWALLERYPTKVDMLEFMSKDVWAANGVFIDMNFNGERIDEHICCVFIGCSGHVKTGINLDKQIVPKLYLSENSELSVNVDGGLLYPINVELYYNSHIKGENLSIADHNSETAKDNIGFSDDELSVKPDLNNEQL